jgi:fibronectin type 3 domain-containing protein
MKYHLLLIFLIFILMPGCERPTEINNEGDGIPPGVPAGLRIYSAGDGEIIIDWLLNTELDVKGYNIYRRTEGVDFLFKAFVTGDFYLDDSLDYDTTYIYSITAVDNDDLESSFTEEVSAKPINRRPPAAPRNLKINARNWEETRYIYLSWQPGEESDLESYRIFRSNEPGFEADSINYISSVSNSEFYDSTAADLYKDYYYTIISIDKGGLRSNQSAVISDRIFESPKLIMPANNSTVNNFSAFIFQGIGSPAKYKVIVQSNVYFGEVWQTEVNSSVLYDTIRVAVPSGVFFYNTNYYWRVASYSASDQPNSISPLYKFIIKP